MLVPGIMLSHKSKVVAEYIEFYLLNISYLDILQGRWNFFSSNNSKDEKQV